MGEVAVRRRRGPGRREVMRASRPDQLGTCPGLLIEHVDLIPLSSTFAQNISTPVLQLTDYTPGCQLLLSLYLDLHKNSATMHLMYTIDDKGNR